MVSKFFLFIILCFGNFFCISCMALKDDPLVIMAELSNENLFPVQQIVSLSIEVNRSKTAISVRSPVRHYVILGSYFRA